MEAAQHADSVFLGPGEDTWPRFLAEFRDGRPQRFYASTTRTLAGVPRIRRDLIKRHLYLVPNSIVVSRGCPNTCDFCYKDSFFRGGRSFYTQSVDVVLAEIEQLPGRHLYFLDDNLFGDPRFALALFDAMRGMGRLWQAAGTVHSALRPELMRRAAASGLRSLFIGFETLNRENLKEHRKSWNGRHGHHLAVRRLHDLGVMINGSFVFGMDHDDEDVFPRTVEWAIKHGIETATFHILTPYPGTALYARMRAQGRILHHNWDVYDTRHCVFRPARLRPAQLEAGYWRAYRDFYTWESILRSVSAKSSWPERIRHLTYTAGWKKFEPMWNFVIRMQKVASMRPWLERLLQGFEPPLPEDTTEASAVNAREGIRRPADTMF
mgnify:CR=1 FL=1